MTTYPVPDGASCLSASDRTRVPFSVTFASGLTGPAELAVLPPASGRPERFSLRLVLGPGETYADLMADGSLDTSAVPSMYGIYRYLYEGAKFELDTAWWRARTSVK